MSRHRLPRRQRNRAAHQVEEPYPNGVRARAVYRGDERIYHDEPGAIRHFVDGYQVAKAEPVVDLMLDPRVKDADVVMAADAIATEAGDAVKLKVRYRVEWTRNGSEAAGVVRKTKPMARAYMRANPECGPGSGAQIIKVTTRSVREVVL